MATPTFKATTPITVAHGDGIGPEIMGATLPILKEAGARLEMIANRGVKVWPEGSPEFRTDAFRCRFMGTGVTPRQVIALQRRIAGLGLEIVMTEDLRNYDGKAGFTLAQGR